MVKITSITALLAAATAATTAAANTTPLLPGSSEVADATSQGLRLVKTADEDPGTWMTEEEKFEKLISKKIGFMDITDTLVSVFFFLASFVLVSPPPPSNPMLPMEDCSLPPSRYTSNYPGDPSTYTPSRAVYIHT